MAVSCVWRGPRIRGNSHTSVFGEHVVSHAFYPEFCQQQLFAVTSGDSYIRSVQ